VSFLMKHWEGLHSGSEGNLSVTSSIKATLSWGAMAKGMRMSQMGDSITSMKKQMEKYEKEAERVDNQTKQRNIDVDKRFDEVMDKLNYMPEMMAAYNKKPETSQPVANAMGWEAEVEAKNQQFVVQNAMGKKIRK
jgi:hypothetical protein